MTAFLSMNGIGKARYPILLFTLCIALFFSMINTATAAPPAPAVLILNAYHPGEAWSDNQIEGIREVFKKAYPFLVPSIEHLDAKRFSNSDHLVLVKQYLKNKYQDKRFDLIMTLDNPALNLMLRFGDELFPHIPIVFAGVNGYRPEMLAGHENITGVAEVQDMAGTLDLALKIHPDTQFVLAVHDYTLSGLAVHRDMVQAAIPFNGKVTIAYPPEATVDDLLAQLKALPQNAIVLLLTYVTDKNGRTLTREESTRLITSASPVPVYAMHETRLGYGIVGGMLLEGSEHGKQAAALALRVLNEDDAARIPVESSRSRPVFDYRVLARFGIQEQLLPADAVIINKPVSIWQKHRVILLPGFVILFVFGISTALLSRMVVRMRRAEQALQASETKYRSMMEAMDDPTYICSRDFRVEYMNAAMIKRVGYDATGELCHEAMHGLNEKCPWCTHKRVMAGEFIKSEVVSPQDNKIFLVSNSPISHVPGSISKLTVFHDITGIKKMEEKLRQAQKMESIGTLAGGIAHDFNNILYPMLGFTELLKEDIPADSPLQTYIDEILRATMRSRDLVKQILAFSRKGEQSAQPVKLPPIVQEALKLLRSSVPSTIDIHQDLDADCGVVVADPTQIHQIVMNLATNAYHAMEESGGRLLVSLKQVEVASQTDSPALRTLAPGSYALLTVSDTGTGIEKEILDKIFDPYFTTKEVGKGTGLGLSVVQGIIKAHKGDIVIDSTPGKGTEVHVYLPTKELPSWQENRPMKN